MTQNSAIVQGVGTAFTSSMANLQLMLGNQAPIYDIISVDVGAQTLTLSAPFVGASSTGNTYEVTYIYIRMPSDFRELQKVKDPSNNWCLYTNITQEQIDWFDPKRTYSSSTPWTLAAATISPVDGVVRYELYPRRRSAHLYNYGYFKQPALMTAPSDSPIYPLRGDVIREGALSELAMWPGIDKDNQNIYHDMNFHREHEERFWKGVYAIETIDNGIREDNITDASDESMVPMDANFWAAHGLPFMTIGVY